MSADYGPRGRIGIAVPHANPTVEPELRFLVPSALGVYATRLTHPSPNVEERISHYIRHIPDAIRSFGPMAGLKAFGFACTGSSYMVSPVEEDQLTAAAEADCGLPVVTAAQAIRAALVVHGARSIALVAPYPAELVEAAARYWERAGIRITARLRVDPQLRDTHRIYELTSGDAERAIERIERSGADCVLASGTGMPTLAALKSLRGRLELPVLSSNLCLAWAVTRLAAPELAPPEPGGLLA
jgi:maleate isomerase